MMAQVAFIMTNKTIFICTIVLIQFAFSSTHAMNNDLVRERILSCIDQYIPESDKEDIRIKPVNGGSNVPSFLLEKPGEFRYPSEVMRESVWSPSEYVQVAKLKGMKPPKKPLFGKIKKAPSHGIDLEKELLSPVPDKIYAASDKISSLLSEFPQSPELHEDAALLLCMFAWRENAGRFYDTRPVLTSATAHLAIAETLRGALPETESNGFLARIILQVLAGRELKAMELIQQRWLSDPEDITEYAWKNALEMRLTCDWRQKDNSREPTYLEVIEIFRAKALRGSLSGALSYYKEVSESRPNLADKSDWIRILNGQTRWAPLSVGLGHVVMRTGFQPEMQEASDGLEIDISNMTGVEPLGAIASKIEEISKSNKESNEIISTSMRAEFYERHILNYAVEAFDFQWNRWSVKRDAIRWLEQMDPHLSKLDRYPLAAPLLAIDRNYFKIALLNARQYLNNYPERVTMRLVDDITKNRFRTRDEHSVNLEITSESRIKPDLIFRCAYNLYNNGDAETFLFPDSSPDPGETGTYSWFRAISPSHPFLCYSRLLQLQGGISLDQIRQIYGNYFDIDYRALHFAAKVVSQKSEDEYIRLMYQVVALNPDLWFDLGHFLVVAGRTDEAAEAFHAGMAQGYDSVIKASYCQWLMQYYWARGDTKEAKKWAEFGRQVYSAHGLSAMVTYYMLNQEPEEAIKVSQEAFKRYGNKNDLLHVYHYHPDVTVKADNDIAVLYKNNKARWFPSGMKKVSMLDYLGKPSPAQGAKLVPWGADSLVLDKTPLNNKVIVALDGWRVENMEQYLFVRSLKRTPEMHFIYWDGQQYKETKVSVPNRLLKCAVVSFGNSNNERSQLPVQQRPSDRNKTAPKRKIIF